VEVGQPSRLSLIFERWRQARRLSYESGVALRLPPQSKTPGGMTCAFYRQSVSWSEEARIEERGRKHSTLNIQHPTEDGSRKYSLAD